LACIAVDANSGTGKRSTINERNHLNRVQTQRERAVTRPVLEALSKLSKGNNSLERRVRWYLTGSNRNTFMTNAEIADDVKVPVSVVDRTTEKNRTEVKTLHMIVKLAARLATDAIMLDRATRRLDDVIDLVESGELDPASLVPAVTYLRVVIGDMQTKFIDAETRAELEKDLCGYEAFQFDPDGPFADAPEILDLEAGESWSVEDLPQLRGAVERCRLISEMMAENFRVNGAATHV